MVIDAPKQNDKEAQQEERRENYHIEMVTKKLKWGRRMGENMLFLSKEKKYKLVQKKIIKR